MFDDLKKNNQTGISSGESVEEVDNKSDSPSSASHPMQDAAPAGNKAEMEDMFAEVDSVAEKPSAVQSGKITPVSKTSLPPQQPPSPTSVQTPLNERPSDDMVVSDNRNGGKIKKMVIIALSIVIVIAIGWVIYNFFITNKIGTVDNNSININQDANVNVDFNVNNNVNSNEGKINPPNEEELDDDYDGLSNAEEKRLGTNPLEPDTDNDSLFDQDEIEIYHTSPLSNDTDNDGLLDYDEVRIWSTDPNNPDSDNDGYSDGTEVDNGYNPLGSGTIDEWSPPIKN